HTLSGVLTAQNQGECIALDFPAQEVEACALPDSLRDALGLEPQYGPYPTFRSADDWLIEAGGEGQIDLLRPNFSSLAHISRTLNLRGVIVTAPAHYEYYGYDFVSRFFAPAVGIAEDPATGSAHTKLAPFWGKRLGKTQLTGFQASKRGGLVRVSWRDARVEIAGQAVTSLRGELLI
ncbi:MAG: PhzF family phenazine biosynthesis protein, partial [Armatimonadetes bacterium]|nr:PhzF family phenazine biosynthesis protein [Armatimonadota bacterium]